LRATLTQEQVQTMKKPLEGVRVLELAAYISGPYSTSILAALGADVVKIEPPEGEAFRIGRNDESPYFVQYNAGKRSVVVNLKSPRGVELIKTILPHFDVVVENMRPGKASALGLGADVCRAINPGIVFTSISGFGSGGELQSRPAYDSIGQAFGGMYTIMNDPGDVRLTGTCVADLITGVSTAISIVAALYGRDKGGKREGVHIETSVLEAVSTLTIDAMTQAFDVNADPVRDTRHPQAQNFCLRTASDDYIVLHLSSSQKFWRGLMQAVGREDMVDDPRFSTYARRVERENYYVIASVLEAEFATRTRTQWETVLAEADVPFAPALTMHDVANHPQTQWLGMIGQSSKGRALVRPPWRLDGERPQRNAHVPRIGEHSREVLGEFFTEAQLSDYLASGVISAA
jgi:formyl-CoA transferase